MGLAGQSIDDGGLRVGLIFGAIVGEKVVHQPGGGAAQDGLRIGQRVLQVVDDCGFGQIGLEALQ